MAPDGGKQKGCQVGVRRSPMTNCSLLLLSDVTLPRSTTHNQKMIELADSLTKSQRFVAIHEFMTVCAPNFRLQFPRRRQRDSARGSASQRRGGIWRLAWQASGPYNRGRGP